MFSFLLLLEISSPEAHKLFFHAIITLFHKPNFAQPTCVSVVKDSSSRNSVHDRVVGETHLRQLSWSVGRAEMRGRPEPWEEEGEGRSRSVENFLARKSRRRRRKRRRRMVENRRGLARRRRRRRRRLRSRERGSPSDWRAARLPIDGDRENVAVP